jgi:membrane protein DedA with SNARE-associated domain
MPLDSITQLILQYRYWILFPLACFEGPVISFIVGMLIAGGYFNPVGAYAILIFGDIIPDTGYYYLGRFGARGPLIERYLSKIGITEEHMDVIQRLWHNHGIKTMFFSKLAYGLSTVFLVSAGLVRMPPRKFYLYALPVTLLQYGALMLLGYYFAASFNLITNVVTDVQVFIAAVAVLIIAYYLLTSYMRTRLLEQKDAP